MTSELGEKAWVTLSLPPRAPCLSLTLSPSVRPALPLEVSDCGRGPQDQEPKLPSGEGAEKAANGQQAASYWHSSAEQSVRALVPAQLSAA